MNCTSCKPVVEIQRRNRGLIFSNCTIPRQITFFTSHRLEVMGLLVGLTAGFFGICGGFLVVPSLLHLGLNISSDIDITLIPVSMFGATTVLGY